MIVRNNKETVAIHHGVRAIAFVYRGVRLVWQAIASCFGAGYWINDYPWKNEDAWKNNT